MRRHAKASTAGSTQRQAGRLGRFFRGAFATRGASADAGGSGAPSHRRGRLALLSLAALALTGLVVLAASAFASKQVIDYFGASGSEGGQFNQPRDIGVNRTGAGGVPTGTIYVVDENNNRIQRFSSSGAFVSAWGADVQTPSVNEEQTLTVEATGGTYTLEFAGEETSALAYDASSTQVRNALRALPAIGSPNVNVSGSGAPFSIEFASALAATNVPQISVDASNLSGAASTGHPQQGFGEYEICTVAASCISGTATGTANFNDNAKNGALDSPQSVAVDQDTGNVYVSDRDNHRINEYSATGAFIRSFGWGVDATTAGGEYEVCPAADRCTTGIAGSGAGQVGSTSTSGTLGIAVSAPDGEAAVGTVFLADSQNRRVDTFSVDGSSPGSFGSSATFGSTQPRNIAVDSRGIVYASNSSHGGDVERYDTKEVNEVQAVTVKATSGKYTLSFEGEATGELEWNAGASEVETALNGLTAINTGGGSVSVSGGVGDETGSSPYEITFDGGPLAHTDVAELAATNVSLAGGSPASQVTVETTVEGSPAFLAPIIPATNETQKVHFAGFSAGDTFTLGNLPASCSSTTTAPIEFTGSAGSGREKMQEALEAKCGAGNFSLASGPLNPVVTFEGAFGGVDVPTMSCTTESGSGTCEITENVNGVAGALLPGSSSTATSGLAVHPDSDGAGADKDILYVLRDPSSGNTVVQQFGPTNEPGLAVAPTEADDEHGGEAGFGSVEGFGLNDASGRLYVSATNNVSGLGNGHRVYILNNVTAPAVTLDPITSFDAHSATFSGEVNPNGDQSRYRFEYVDNAEFLANGFENAEQVPIVDVSLGAGTSSIPVEAETPHHLVPSTTYHVRLLATQVFTATETTSEQTFTTPGEAPSFKTDATGVGSEEATLRAAINPEGEEVTDYHFQWGTSESYGSSSTPGTIPAGSEPVAVEEELTGLTSGQTYHYRLLATNGTGTTTGPDETFTTIAPQPPPGECPNEAIRQQQGSQSLPECRGYELVSPYPTGGVPVYWEGSTASIGEGGDRVGMKAALPFPGAELPPTLPDTFGYGSTPGSQYELARTASGWQPHQTGISSRTNAGWSGDGSRWLFQTASRLEEDSTGRLDPDDQNHQFQRSEEDVYERLPDNSFLWISRDPRIPVGTPQTAFGAVELAVSQPGAASASANGRTVVLKSQRQLLDADTTVDPPGFSGNWPFRLYKWHEGQLSFIGKRPDGSVPAKGSAMEHSGGPNQVSHNGDRVVWKALRDDSASTSTTIYIQRDGEPTVEAVKETGVPTLPLGQPYNVRYRGAAADDSRVFFTSASRLTPDSGGGATSSGNVDLYVYDLAANKVRDLTPRLDGIEDPSVDPPVADRARVLGVAANSEDGKTVYFVADAQYDTAPNPAGELPSASGRNLYMARLNGIDGPIELRFIGTLAARDEGDWDYRWDPETHPVAGPDQPRALGKTAYGSPDGSVLGFSSTLDLAAGQTTGATPQVYAYDAGTSTLRCASCPTDGSLPSGWPNLGDEIAAATFWEDLYTIRRWVTSDGGVLFNTPTPLLPADQNTTDDVYEYRAGQLMLISSGTGTERSQFVNATPDGSTILFTTGNTLVPRDKEPGIPKLYAARVDGGFPYVAPEPPCDFNAGACEGEPSTAPNVPGAGTSAFEGPGNVEPTPGLDRCKRVARSVLRLAHRAKRLRLAARRTRDASRARRLRHKARRYARAARRRHSAAKRCRRRVRAANTNGRASR